MQPFSWSDWQFKVSGKKSLDVAKTYHLQLDIFHGNLCSDFWVLTWSRFDSYGGRQNIGMTRFATFQFEKWNFFADLTLLVQRNDINRDFYLKNSSQIHRHYLILCWLRPFIWFPATAKVFFLQELCFWWVNKTYLRLSSSRYYHCLHLNEYALSAFMWNWHFRRSDDF